MKTLHSNADRRTVQTRIAALAPDTRPHWGKMTAAQMVVHVTDVLRMATGDLLVKSMNAPFRQ